MRCWFNSSPAYHFLESNPVWWWALFAKQMEFQACGSIPLLSAKSWERGVMDNTLVFGTKNGGSSPSVFANGKIWERSVTGWTSQFAMLKSEGSSPSVLAKYGGYRWMVGNRSWKPG
jgi:hypothetical protein